MNSRLGPNSLMVEYVDMDRALEDIRRLERDRDGALWAMGDIAERVFRAVTATEGMRRAFAREGVTMAGFSRQLGVSPSRLRALRLVARTFQAKERHAELSWEHHQAIARHLGAESTSTRRKWLRDAHKHGWTPRQLSRKLAERRASAPRTSVEERVERLRRRLAEAEAELAHRRRRGTKK